MDHSDLAQWNDWGVEDMDVNIQALTDAGLKPTAVLGFNEPNHAEQACVARRCHLNIVIMIGRPVEASLYGCPKHRKPQCAPC